MLCWVQVAMARGDTTLEERLSKAISQQSLPGDTAAWPSGVGSLQRGEVRSDPASLLTQPGSSTPRPSTTTGTGLPRRSVLASRFAKLGAAAGSAAASAAAAAGSLKSAAADEKAAAALRLDFHLPSSEVLL